MNVIIADAREVLQTTPKRYDVVFSEPSNPYRAGIASLYTQEFYQQVAERLTDGGVFVQWLQAYEVDAQTVRTVYATLDSVFPHVETWEGRTDDLLLVCSNRPIRHDSMPNGRACRNLSLQAGDDGCVESQRGWTAGIRISSPTPTLPS